MTEEKAEKIKDCIDLASENKEQTKKIIDAGFENKEIIKKNSIKRSKR